MKKIKTVIYMKLLSIAKTELHDGIAEIFLCIYC